jgi:hypothetical protein
VELAFAAAIARRLWLQIPEAVGAGSVPAPGLER